MTKIGGNCSPQWFISGIIAMYLGSTLIPDKKAYWALTRTTWSGIGERQRCLLELGHDIVVKGSLWAMKNELVFSQHHQTIAGLQKYQCDDPEKGTNTSVSDTKQMFVACNIFHGHAPPFVGNILSLQQFPFVCLCPEFQHSTEICETLVWEIDALMQDQPCDTSSMTLSCSSDKIVIFFR